MNRRTLALASLVTLSTTTLASAHPGHGEHGLTSGLAHPITGLDHLLAMLAVGLLAAGLTNQVGSSRHREPSGSAAGLQFGGRDATATRPLILLPLTFVLFMTLGAFAGSLGLFVPSWLAENGIAASVVVLGLLITLGSRIPLPLATVAAALFAICHGSAHAAEMPIGQSAVGFFAGFIASTVFLHFAGIAIGLIAAKLKSSETLRYAGGAIAACGLLIAIGVL